MSAVMKRNYNLNQNQRRILVLTYKFRFVTIPLLQEYLGLKNPSTVWRTLKTLEEQEYIASIFDKSFVKISKPAYYFLDKKGLAVLKEDPELNAGVLHSYYKNKSLAEETRDHALDVMAAYNSLKATYPNSYYMFTRNELGGFGDFPEHKPDLYLRKTDDSSEYFITLAHDAQPFIIRKRLAEYVEHSEEEGWPSGEYPALLYVFKTGSHESQFLDHAEKVLDSAGIENDELPIATTTIKALTTKPYTAAIWTFLGDATPAVLE